MSRSGPDLRKAIAPVVPCEACNNSGVVMGVFHELECVTCDGVGWLPVAGHDLTQQLGRTLAKVMRVNRLLREALPDKATEYHTESGRAGQRGNYVGD